MDKDILFGKIDELYPKYVKVWEDVCNIESPTGHKPGVDAVCHYFKKMAEEKGWHTEVLKLDVSGDALCITMNPESKEKPICLSGHVDTVHPVGFFGNPPVRIEDGKIYGPGVTDCKGGVVSSFLAMDALFSLGFGKRPVKLILQSDEETSSKGSNKETVKFMLEKAKDAVAFFNCESCKVESPWTVALERKGILRYEFTVRGKAAHSAVCYEGTSAICEAAHKIVELEKYKDPDGITCNCGLISGGTAANTVAEECSFVADIRLSTEKEMEEVAEIVQRIANENKFPETKCECTLISDRPPMELKQTNIELFEKLNVICENYGLEKLKHKKRNGGSDAAYITQAGIPCVDNIGVLGCGIHSQNEFALLSSLADSAKHLAAFLCSL